MGERIVELAIIGGGPAGVSAGVYAARKQLKTVLITESYGGQSVESQEIQNWIGTKSISGYDFSKLLKDHLEEYKGDYLELIEKRATAVKKENGKFHIEVGGEMVISDSLLITSGSVRRKLDVPGSAELEHKGLTYCASCDGPLFAGKDVVVIGGGNAGFETAAQLLAYAKSVTLLHRSDEYRADKVTVEKVLANEKMTGIKSANIKTVFGDKFVEGITYEKDGEEKTLNVGGIFVEIGLIPSTKIFKDIVKLDKIGRIIVDPRTQQTSDEKIWAAGDCSDGIFHQNNVASGDAVKALEHIYINR